MVKSIIDTGGVGRERGEERDGEGKGEGEGEGESALVLFFKNPRSALSFWDSS